MIRGGTGDQLFIDTVGTHGFQDIVRGDRILFQILARMLGAKANIRIGGQVKDKIRAAHGGSFRYTTDSRDVTLKSVTIEWS